MKYQPSDIEKRDYISDLKAEYLFVFLPFVILILVKIYFGSPKDVIYYSDWSLAASILLGQNATKVARTISKIKETVNGSNFSWYSAKRFLFVVIALFFYFGMIFKPNVYLACSQMFIFIMASFFHFKDGFAVKMLEKRALKKIDF